MPTGALKWYKPARGFGFVAPSDGGKDVFLPISATEQAGHGDPQTGIASATMSSKAGMLYSLKSLERF